jgi:hypothetical protein
MMKFLLDPLPICPNTTELVRSAGHNESYHTHIQETNSDGDPRKHEQNREMLEMLIDHEQNLFVTEELMVTVLVSSYRNHSMRDQPYTIIQRLFDRKPDLIVTETMLKSCERSDDMRILLQHAMGMRISPEVLEAISNTFHRASELISFY